ncbi:MAG: hypothetical protein LC640_06645 [Frankia sp.]|nr:hypothetical protein [Frankia sp.]
MLVRGGAPLSPSTSSAVALNVTAIAATEQTDVRVYPTRAGSGPPQVSNLNPPAGRTTPAAVIVAVGDDGTVSLRNAAGAVHLAVDLLGWYTPGTDAAVFHPVAPRRVLDTRSGAGSLGPGETRDLFVAGATVVPFAAQAVVVNVTAVGATAASDVRVYPRPAAPSDPPNASNLNVVAGQTASNAVIVGVGAYRSIRLRNQSGSLHVVVDLAGWFGPAGDGWDLSWPQCTAAGSTVSVHPPTGAFAVVGMNRSRPFTDNECFADEYGWASGLPGGAAVYVNTNAPGPANARWADPGPRPCDATSHTDPGCGYNWGWNLAHYVQSKLPVSAAGGPPFIWLDVEGCRPSSTCTSGPTWSPSQPVNAQVVVGILDVRRSD